MNASDDPVGNHSREASVRHRNYQDHSRGDWCTSGAKESDGKK